MSFVAYGLITGCVYGLWATSFSLIYRATRIFHVAHAAVFTAAAYVYWMLVGEIGAPAALVCALAFGVALGVASEVLLYRPLLKGGASPVLLFVVSLGVYTVVENAIQLIWGAGAQSVPVPFANYLQSLFSVFGAGISAFELVEASLAALLWLALLAFLRWTLAGMAIRAITIAPDMAELAGIDVGRVRVITFAVGSLLISIAGVTMLIKTGIEPSSGLPVWVVGIVAALISRASVFGSFIAGLGLGLSESVILIWLHASWQPTVPVMMLIGYLIVETGRGWFVSWQLRRAAHRNLANANLPI